MAASNGFPGAGRKIAFEILGHLDANVAGPRLGKLSVKGRHDVETPNFFSVTSRGVIPHLTPDVISSHTHIGGVHIALEDCKGVFFLSCDLSTDIDQLSKEQWAARRR